MPARSKRVCNGCRQSVAPGPCPTCRPAQRKRWSPSEASRPSAWARGYDAKWQETRLAYLAANPYCQCTVCSRLPTFAKPLAVDVHHKDNLGPRGPRGHDWTNLVGMTHGHHSRITATEDGGFGRRKVDRTQPPSSRGKGDHLPSP